LKIKLFIWLAADDKILTWDNLLRRGWEGPNICFLCHLNSESITHLFLDCTFTQQVWHRLSFSLKLGSIWSGSSLQTSLEDWTKEESSYPHLPTLVCWHIWLVRNRAIFEQILLLLILFATGLWVVWRYQGQGRNLLRAFYSLLTNRDGTLPGLMEPHKTLVYYVELVV
jgi:hypothetical protein